MRRNGAGTARSSVGGNVASGFHHTFASCEGRSTAMFEHDHSSALLAHTARQESSPAPPRIRIARVVIQPAHGGPRGYARPPARSGKCRDLRKQNSRRSRPVQLNAVRVLGSGQTRAPHLFHLDRTKSSHRERLTRCQMPDRRFRRSSYSPSTTSGAIRTSVARTPVQPAERTGLDYLYLLHAGYAAALILTTDRVPSRLSGPHHRQVGGLGQGLRGPCWRNRRPSRPPRPDQDSS